jgi:hypothetical protein
MGRQVVEHDADLIGLRIVDVDELAHALGEVAGRPMLGDLDLAPGPVRVEEDEQVDGAVAPILVVITLELPRFGRNRLAHLADELGRALVEAHHRPLRIGRLGIEIEHILHARDIGAVNPRNAPHVPAPGLEVVLGQAPAHRLARQAVMLGEPDHRVGQQLQRPARPPLGRGGAGGRHQKGFLLARQLAVGAAARLLAESRLQIAFDEAPLGSVHRRPADRDANRDILIPRPRVGGQQDLPSLELAGGVLAPAQQGRELIALVLVQLDPVTYIHRRPLLVRAQLMDHIPGRCLPLPNPDSR